MYDKFTVDINTAYIHKHCSSNKIWKEKILEILSYEGKKPEVKKNVFIAKGAFLIGDVAVDEDSSIWFNSVVRGDMEKVRIGSKTNIQDGSVLHCDAGSPLIIGDNVTIGHKAIVHGCIVEDNVLIGMGAIIMNGAVVGEGSIIAAGSTVLEKTIIPPYSLAAGSPAKIKKTLPQNIIEIIRSSAEHYAEVKDRYLAE